MRIGLDLDGVVVNFNLSAARELNNEFGYNIPYEVPKTWGWNKEVGVSDEHWSWVFNEGASFVFGNAPPLDGAFDFIRELDSLGDICVVTTRPKGAWFETLSWISDLFPVPPREIHFYDVKGNKAESACDVYIDDKTENIHDVLRAGHKGVLLAYPYNEWAPPYIPRVANYEEILEWVKAQKTD